MRTLLITITIATLLNSCAQLQQPASSPGSQGESNIPSRPTQSIQSGQPTEFALELLREREGYSKIVYMGANGNLTAGLGHLLTSDELNRYREGDTVPDDVLARWDREDTAEAWAAAAQQARDIAEPRLTEALFALNYQLGVFWYTDHPSTWAHLEDQNWDAAAAEAENSQWYEQTQVRVEDFQRALNDL